MNNIYITVKDISYETYGKYHHTTKYKGYWFASEDCNRYGEPKDGSISDTKQADVVKYNKFLFIEWFTSVKK